MVACFWAEQSGLDDMQGSTVVKYDAREGAGEFRAGSCKGCTIWAERVLGKLGKCSPSILPASKVEMLLG